MPFFEQLSAAIYVVAGSPGAATIGVGAA